MAGIKLFFLLVVCTSTVWCLSCPPCGNWPCETPSCCPSGEYTTDACGCCLECASPQEGVCGGPWHTSGTCAANLRCLRKCECKAENGASCVFPFIWRGKTYTSCTKDKSTNGKPWCATAVNAEGKALRGSLKDCNEGCPGTDYECTEGDLFNLDGKCVQKSSAQSLARSSVVPAQIDEYYGDDSKELEAPLCPTTKNIKDGQKLCKCGPALSKVQGGTEGGCQDDSINDYNSYGDEEDNGWCYLENVQDPNKPSTHCYDDVEWSVSRGKFWSRKACTAEAKEEEYPIILEELIPEPTGKPLLFPIEDTESDK